MRYSVSFVLGGGERPLRRIVPRGRRAAGAAGAVPGPAAGPGRWILLVHPEGGQDRVQVLAASDGIWDCSFVGECSAACPKGVDPAKAIQQTKFDTVNGFVMDAMLTPFGGRG